MSKRHTRIYTQDFKLEALKLCEEIGIVGASRRLDMPEGTLANWVKRWKKQGSLGSSRPEPEPGSLAALQSEVNRLRKDNAVLKTDLEILKKATAYFAKESR